MQNTGHMTHLETGGLQYLENRIPSVWKPSQFEFQCKFMVDLFVSGVPRSVYL